MFELFEKISDTSSRNEKLALLETASDTQIKLLQACYDPYRQFHIRKWKMLEVDKKGAFLNDAMAVNQFFALIKKLEDSNRSNEMVSEVEQFFSRCNDKQKKWLAAVLQKDLKIGINVKTINLALGAANRIPTFEVMLANRFGNGTISEFPEKEGDWIIQPKLDGFRAILQGWNGVFVGRSGKALPNQNLTKLVDNMNYPFVFDGELYSHEIGFNALSSILRNETADVPDHVRFVIWDIIPKEDWLKKKTSMSYYNRFMRLGIFLKDLNKDFFKLISYSLMYSHDDREYLTIGLGKRKRINPLIPFRDLHRVYSFYLQSGYEGAMAKNPDMPYEWRRSLNNMYKIKPEETADAKILGVYEGTGKYIGKLGGLTVEMYTENDVRIEVNVGGGFSDLQREQFWENSSDLIGSWCEIFFTEKSYAAGSSTPTGLRHPRFVRIRDDKE